MWEIYNISIIYAAITGDYFFVVFCIFMISISLCHTFVITQNDKRSWKTYLVTEMV